MATFRQGAQDTNAFLDIESIYEVRAQNEREPSAYAGAGQLAHFTTLAHEPMFVSNDRRHDGDERLYVSSALNGYGSDATAAANRFPDIEAVDRLELIRQSVKASISFAGVAIAGCNVADASVGCAVSVSGLETVVIGNGQCGPTYVDPKIRPGQALVWDVPSPTLKGLDPPKGGYHPEELFRTKYRLQLRPRNPASTASTLLFHARMVTTDRDKWAAVMRPKSPATSAWDHATRGFAKMLTTAASLVLYKLLERGTISINDGDANPMSPNDAANAVASLAERIGAIDSANEASDDLAEVIGRTLFVNSTPVKADKPWDASLPLAREYLVNKGNESNAATPVGKLLHGQLNAFRQGIAAILTAHAEEDRFNAGVALTGADGESQMHVNIAQGIRR